jgi:hypothetical protein
MIGREVTDGPTPNGGVRLMSFFVDAAGAPAAKENAAAIEVVELDAAGAVVATTYLERQPGPDDLAAAMIQAAEAGDLDTLDALAALADEVAATIPVD